MKTFSVKIISLDGRVNRKLQGISIPCSVGRDPKCEIPIDNSSCSKKHAVIQEQAGKIVVVDQGSRNGIYDELGNKAQSITVSTVTRVRIGKVWLELIPEWIPAAQGETDGATVGCESLEGQAFPKIMPAKRPSPEPARTPSLVSSPGIQTLKPKLAANDDSDHWFDQFVTLLGKPGTAMISVGCLVGVHLLLQTASVPSTIGFLAQLVMIAVSCVIAAGASLGLAKIFSGEGKFAGFYWTYLCCVAVFWILALTLDYDMVVHPEGTSLRGLLGVLGLIPGTFLLFFNLRKIWRINPQILARIAAVIVIAAAYRTYSLGGLVVKKPDWKTAKSSPSFSSAAYARIPASAYVPTDQLMTEMSESLAAAKRPAAQQ